MLERREGMDWDDEEALETQVIEMTMDNALLLQALITRLIEKGVVSEEELQEATDELLRAEADEDSVEFEGGEGV